MICDTHTHYDDEAFAEDRDEILGKLKAEGIGKVVAVAAEPESIDRVLELVEQREGIYAAIGVHPDYAGRMDEEILEKMRDSVSGREPGTRPVAIGEIGLDYHWMVSPREVQREWFIKQAELAMELDLPVIIHSRDAAEDTMETVKSLVRKGDFRAVMHCYSYSPEQAGDYLDMGLYIGVGGVVTFKNAKKLVETVRLAPLERILLETDCPYLAPEPFRGKRNSSLYLPYVIERIAQIKDVDAKEVEAVTYENARRFFSLG